MSFNQGTSVTVQIQYQSEAVDYKGACRRIQDAVLHIFQRRPLPYSYYTLQSNLRRLIRTDTGPIIYDYFKDQLLKKGMVILRESMKNLKGVALLEKLSETWNYFYKEIIFTLQAILYPFQDNSTEEMPMTIRQVILADFRDTVLLKINQDVEEALEASNVPFEPIKQMVLVLQGLYDGSSLETQLKLERLVVRAVRPYLGVRGLYVRDTEPVVEASTNITLPPKDTDASKILLNALVHGRNSNFLSFRQTTSQHGSRHEVSPDPTLEQAHSGSNTTSTSGRKRLWPAPQPCYVGSKLQVPCNDRRQVVSMTPNLMP
ncbi:proline-rich protein 5 isoform X5 [Octopus sinensis]|uniref:Proline-rich protein 5 isoform X5 n=1 Tax=Octopus sinensis TaxID=2607531 RepID=A0A6P7S4I5_9MOLL|nr:proline-rich protein 5 isoform X5 [Octopus sinensis]